MPHLDRTGPEGAGPGTGRNFGRCSKASDEEKLQGLGKGMGKRRLSGGGEGRGKRLQSGLKKSIFGTRSPMQRLL
jgi:hypothetical protein